MKCSVFQTCKKIWNNSEFKDEIKYVVGKTYLTTCVTCH